MSVSNWHSGAASVAEVSDCRTTRTTSEKGDRDTWPSRLFPNPGAPDRPFSVVGECYSNRFVLFIQGHLTKVIDAVVRKRHDGLGRVANRRCMDHFSYTFNLIVESIHISDIRLLVDHSYGRNRFFPHNDIFADQSFLPTLSQCLRGTSTRRHGILPLRAPAAAGKSPWIMRNVFDQYVQPENCLTHALVTALHEDPRLLRAFMSWTLGKALRSVGLVEIVEQQLPGELERDEGEASSIPDAWIRDGEGWCLLIESKISSPLENNQLRRHMLTATRRGFTSVNLLAIDVVAPKEALSAGVRFRRWSEVYEWLIHKASTSAWAGRTAAYFEVAERERSNEGYLREGTLTMFTGFAFGHNEPYSYLEAKRLLRLAMDELRRRKDLVDTLGMDSGAKGRSAITGSQSDSVWDYLPLVGAHEKFTQHPHLTLSVQSERLVTIISVPNGIQPRLRRRIVELGLDGFVDLARDISERLSAVSRDYPGATPYLEAAQRRYPSQRAEAIYDARIEFDLRTAFGDDTIRPRLKRQSQWLTAIYEATANRRSNLHLGMGALFPWGRCRATGERRILDGIAEVWIACRPLLQVMGLATGEEVDANRE